LILCQAQEGREGGKNEIGKDIFRKKAHATSFQRTPKELVMRPQALIVVLLCAFIGGCGQGSEPSTISPDEVGQVKQAVVSSWTSSLPAGYSTTMAIPITAPAGMPFVVSVIPEGGDPELSLLHKNSRGFWESVVTSSNPGDRLVEKLTVIRPITEEINFQVVGKTATSYRFSLSYESLGQMDLDVPYLNQNTVGGGIGSSSCGCTSLEMILAYWARDPADAATMKSNVTSCYWAPGMSAPSSSGIKNRLLDPMLKYNFSSVVVTSVGSLTADALYAKIQSEIRAGRPMILSSRKFTSDGHFVVVTGFNGSSYTSSSEILVNDPYGTWNQSCNDVRTCYSRGTYAKAVPYNFDKVRDTSTGNLITIQ
jgi:hypothetical protein